VGFRLAIPVLLAGVLLPSCALAQFRGGGHAFASSPRGFGGGPPRVSGGFSSFHPSASPVRIASPVRTAPPFRNSRPFGSAPRSSWVGSHRGGSGGGYGGGHRDGGWHRSHRPRFFFGGSYFNPFYYPAYNYPIYWGPPFDDESSQPPEQEQAPPAENDQAMDQIQNLTDEVDELRGQVSARNWQSFGQTAQAKVEPNISTILVFHDGHQMEVQNYAVAGNVVWVFGDQTARKIPLSDLDLDVTQKLNADRGVEFTASAQANPSLPK
jgi:hypothetical protein